MAKKNQDTKNEIEEKKAENNVKNDNLETTKNSVLDNKEIKNLRIKIAFTDKYTNVDYKENAIIPFEKDRADELLKDKRGLVENA